MPRVGATEGRTESNVKYCENPGSSGSWVWCQGALGAKSGGSNALVMPMKLKCLLRVFLCVGVHARCKACTEKKDGNRNKRCTLTQ